MSRPRNPPREARRDRRRSRRQRAAEDRAAYAAPGRSALELPRLAREVRRFHWEDVAEKPTRRKSSASSMMSTPSDFAFSSLLPASSPATRKLVAFDTEPVTRPPAASITAVAFALLKVGRVPVITAVFPLNGPPAT